MKPKVLQDLSRSRKKQEEMYEASLLGPLFLRLLLIFSPLCCKMKPQKNEPPNPPVTKAGPLGTQDFLAGISACTLLSEAQVFFGEVGAGAWLQPTVLPS